MLSLPIKPEEATKILLKKLPSRRMRDVLEKRYGLKGGKKKTLEAIGTEYKITRERVRQIETDAMRQLSKPEHYREIEPLFKSLEDQFHAHGATVAEHHLFSMLPSARHIPHVTFLLHVGKPFMEIPEAASYHRRWAIDKQAAALAEKILENTHAKLDAMGRPVSAGELHDILQTHAQEHAGKELSEDVRSAYLHASKAIRKNPYGEYGLVSWSTINPRGVKDKAHLVLYKAQKPMHFREVAEAINKMSWGKKRAHPQTVHNELIKDKRFVLVGRGLYALKEWGYEPGTVRDILLSVFKNAKRPLSRDEVVNMVLEKRFVKPPTILLNLQDKSLFKRVEGEKYTLV